MTAVQRFTAKFAAGFAWKAGRFMALTLLFTGTIYFCLFFFLPDQPNIGAACGLAIFIYGVIDFTAIVIKRKTAENHERWSAIFFLGCSFIACAGLLRGALTAGGFHYAMAVLATILCAVTLRNTIYDFFMDKSPKEVASEKIQQVSVHEAGHVCAAAAAAIPERLGRTNIELAPPDPGVYGVTRLDRLCYGADVDMRRQRMLIEMAGQMAEISVFGFSANGSASDHRKYLAEACAWLEEKGLSNSPESVRRLMDHDRKNLDLFFRRNRRALLLVADSLYRRSVLDAGELDMFMRHITPLGVEILDYEPRRDDGGY